MMDTFLARRSTLITLTIKTRVSKERSKVPPISNKTMYRWKTRREINFNFVAYRAKEKTGDIVDQLDQVSPQQT
jgi:hypothetical protein